MSNRKISGASTSRKELGSDADTSQHDWIMHGINRLDGSINRLSDKLDDTSENLKNDIQEKVDKVDGRLRAIERNVYLATGGLAVIMIVWSIIQWLLGNYDISLTERG